MILYPVTHTLQNNQIWEASIEKQLEGNYPNSEIPEVFKWWNEVDNFRVVPFHSASDDTKTAWNEYFCTYMLPVLSLQPKKHLNSKKKAWKRYVTPSDEGFAIYLLKEYGDAWYNFHMDIGNTTSNVVRIATRLIE